MIVRIRSVRDPDSTVPVGDLGTRREATTGDAQCHNPFADQRRALIRTSDAWLDFTAWLATLVS